MDAGAESSRRTARTLTGKQGGLGVVQARSWLSQSSRPPKKVDTTWTDQPSVPNSCQGFVSCAGLEGWLCTKPHGCTRRRPQPRAAGGHRKPLRAEGARETEATRAKDASQGSADVQVSEDGQDQTEEPIGLHEAPVTDADAGILHHGRRGLLRAASHRLRVRGGTVPGLDRHHGQPGWGIIGRPRADLVWRRVAPVRPGRGQGQMLTRALQPQKGIGAWAPAMQPALEQHGQGIAEHLSHQGARHQGSQVPAPHPSQPSRRSDR
mmetsp:Transcript_80880/g.251131  ORF Transcript_80880/g.251131 Transcript_80880/m.251131 type:complete len:265 (-) Transcript_80880:960-1754(-)